MKYLLLLSFFLPVSLTAQDCKIKRTTDPYTKEVMLTTGFIELDGASVSVNADTKEIDLFFSMDAKEKCFGDESTAIVNFDGKKVKRTYRNNGPVNCDGIFHLIFKNQATPPSLLQQLLTQKIISIQFMGNNKSQINVGFTDEQQQQFVAKAECLIKEAAGLIK